jgi:hypothetical protein
MLLQLTGLKQIKGQNATYRNQMGALRTENMSLQRKTSDLARQIADVHGTPGVSPPSTAYLLIHLFVSYEGRKQFYVTKSSTPVSSPKFNKKKT